MIDEAVGLLGATSNVGACLIGRFSKGVSRRVFAFSRSGESGDFGNLIWCKTDQMPRGVAIPSWISLAPIWVLQDYFPYLEQCGARRVIAFSSTSRFTKADSPDVSEQDLARRLREAEERLTAWAEKNGVDWCILRPTLIYGLGRDHNISELIRIIRRYRFFPLLGQAKGLRQPVHADDLAQACVSALDCPVKLGRSYELSGGETLSYRHMIERIFQALGMKPRFLRVPLPLFRFVIGLLRLLPRYRKWSGAMAERMNQDLVFDHADASRDLDFRPRKFMLSSEDLPLG